MSGFGPLLILLGFLGALGAILVLAWWLSDRRRWQMRALAMRLGWTFQHAQGERVEAALQGFSGVIPGPSAQALSTLTGWLRVGKRRLPALMGDHACRDAHGADPRQGENRTFSYLAVQLPAARTPELVVRLEGIKDLPGRVLGSEQVHLESDAFNRKFHVRCEQKKFAFAVLHPRMMEFLQAAPAPTIEIRNGWIRLTDGPRRWRPTEFVARLSWAERFLALWPEYLWAELESA